MFNLKLNQVDLRPFIIKVKINKKDVLYPILSQGEDQISIKYW
jgi:hypothetical protein